MLWLGCKLAIVEASGVYLYRIITNHNGKSLDKFTRDGDNDKYFKQDYGKMYLMW